MIRGAPLAALGLVLLCAPAALAQTRGLSVQVRASEAPEAAIAEEIELYRESYALVIGIDDYRSGWPRLSNAVKDAELVAEAMAERGFEVMLHRDLDSSALDRVLKEFFVLKGKNPESRLFLWYAGHGHTIDGEGFLVPADAPLPDDEAEFKLSAYSIRNLAGLVRLAKSRHVFAVFDSCFAGTIFDTQRSLPSPAITLATTQKVRQFLTSGDAGQTVSDDGTFRRLFLDGLAGEERADLNQDGYVTGSEIGSFLSDRVTNLTQAQQTPRYGKLRDPDFDRGDFVFAGRGISAPAPPQDAATTEIELEFWRSIKDSTNPADFEAFVALFPNSPFTRLAHNRLGELGDEAGTAERAADAEAAARSFKDCDECPEMVVIPAGTFTMGSPAGERGRFADEGPLREVTIELPFALSRYEVTNNEFAAFAWESGYPRSGNCGRTDWHPGDLHPVICVSWYDARAYVAWLARKTGKPYRLPSEAEWEYAVRAGNATPYSWGVTVGTNNANCDGCGSEWDGEDTAAVGSFAPNLLGLYDMHGNALEWVADCWHDNYAGAPAGARAWTEGDCAERVGRGGNFRAEPHYMRSATRIGSFASSGRGGSWGIRVAVDLEPVEIAVAGTPLPDPGLVRAFRVPDDARGGVTTDVVLRAEVVLEGHDYNTTAAFSPDGSRLLTAAAEPEAWLWDVTTGARIGTYAVDDRRVTWTGFATAGSRVMAADDDGNVTIWTIGEPAEPVVLDGEDRLMQADTSPDGRHVATVYRRHETVQIWDAETGSAVATLKGHLDTVDWAAFGPDGARVVTGAEDGTARVWDAASGEQLAILLGHSGWVRFAAFDPSGRRIVTRGTDNAARLWDAATGAELAVLHGYVRRIEQVAFNPDGTRLLAVFDDTTVAVWDVATSDFITLLKGHEDDVNQAAYDPSGTRIATASEDETARIWDAATGDQLAILEGHENGVVSLAFSPDGTRLATASRDRTVRLWDVSAVRANGVP